MINRRLAMIWEQTRGHRNRCRARQFLPFSDSTHTLVKINKQHAVIGHEAMMGCLVRISMPRDVLTAWKNYLLTQTWEDKNTHINLTGLTHLVTRATNRVPAGFDTGYPIRALEPLRSVLDSSFLNRPRDMPMGSIFEAIVRWSDDSIFVERQEITWIRT